MGGVCLDFRRGRARGVLKPSPNVVSGVDLIEERQQRHGREQFTPQGEER